MHIIILIAVGILLVLVGSGLHLMHREVKIKLLHGQLYFICPGRVQAIAFVFYVGGTVIAVLALGTALVWYERFWATVTGVVPYRPFWFPLWMSVFLGGVAVSVLGFVVGCSRFQKRAVGQSGGCEK